MKKIFLLSGENLDLAREEVLALTTKKHKQFGKVLILDSSKKFLEKRLAYTHKIYDFLFETDKKRLCEDMERFNWKKIYKKSFCLRVVGNKEYSEAELAGYIWRAVKKPKVDLLRAETKIDLVFHKDKIFCGLVVGVISKDFLKRKPHLRPELHPSSLDPRLARCMVNLSGTEKGFLLDPFCGTGGILIEAGLMGFKVVGYDNNKTMLKKTEKNLKHYKIKNFKLELKDATKTKTKFDYVVSDLPYGKNTKNIDKELYLNFLKNLKKILKKKAVLGFPGFVDKSLIKKAKLKIEKEFRYYLHKSLSKKIFLLNP